MSRITINIHNLIGNFSVSSQNIESCQQKIKDKITEAILSAVDSAGIELRKRCDKLENLKRLKKGNISFVFTMDSKPVSILYPIANQLSSEQEEDYLRGLVQSIMDGELIFTKEEWDKA